MGCTSKSITDSWIHVELSSWWMTSWNCTVITNLARLIPRTWQVSLTWSNVILKKAQTKNVSQKTACTGKMCWRKMENLFTPIYRDNGYFRKADAFTMTSHSALQIRRSTTCLSLQRTITWMLSQLRIFWIFVWTITYPWPTSFSWEYELISPRQMADRLTSP